MRYIYQDVARDGNGVVLRGATINVYLAGTTTAATIYTSVTSTTGVNSVTTSSTDGSFSFYVDAFDYGSFQKFKFVLSKPTLTDSTFTADEVSVDEVVTGTYTISTAKTVSNPIVVPYGVIFSKSGSGSIAFNGSFQSGLYQIFDSTFSSGITFGAGSVKEVSPEWWAVNTVPGTTDMTAAIQSAVNSFSIVKFSKNTYYTNTITVNDGNRLIGSGIGHTTIKQNTTTGASYGTFYIDSGSSSTQYSNNLFSDFTIDGQVATKGFSEFEHLISASGVDGLIVERVKFLGFRGDGLLIGASHAAATERHNYNVTIRDCIFDGVNNDNRNGISIIDGTNITIENNYFKNCSKTSMPGAIDIEPDSQTYYVVNNIKIIRNRFSENKGSNGSISVQLPDVAYSSQPTNFLIDGNSIESSDATDPGIRIVHTGDAVSTRKHHIRIVNNRIYNTGRGIQFSGLNGVLFSSNIIDNTKDSALIGYNVAGNKVLNISFTNNIFKKIANDNTVGGSGIAFFTIDYLLIKDNTFIDCGKANGTLGYALDFNTGTSSYVSIIGNKFENPSTLTTFAIQKEAAHTFTNNSNKYYLNQFISCTGNAFTYSDSDISANTWTPVLAGSSTAGSHTYSLQVGRYHRIGRLIWVSGTIGISSKDTNMAGDSLITGLPFAISNITSLYPAVSFSQWAVTLSANFYQLSGRCSPSESQIRIEMNGSGQVATPLPASGIANGSQLIFSGIYLADEL